VAGTPLKEEFVDGACTPWQHPRGRFVLTGTHPPRSGRLGTASLATLLIALLFFPASAGADQAAQPLPFGQWTAFDAGAAGSFDAQGLFSFRSDTPVIVRVTDAFCRGDRYRLLDHGHRRMTTSNVPLDPTCSEQPFASTGPQGWHDAGYSKGRVRLGPGRHRIRIRSLRSPFGSSTGFIEVIRVPPADPA
jgi:hypothetical protein